jgi:hypothetical protein
MTRLALQLTWSRVVLSFFLSRSIKDIFKRLFRIFAIIYHRHFPTIEAHDAAGTSWC